MNKEDYIKYYIQGSDHYLVPKYEFIELFSEMENWREESQRQKEVIDKITNAIDGDIDGFITINEYGECNAILDLLEIYKDILKEVSE